MEGAIVLFSWAAVAVAQVQSGRSSQVALAPSDEDAVGLMRQGIELRRAGRDQDALDLFQRAERVAPSPRGLAQIGLAEQALGRWVAANRHLGSALKNQGDPWIARNHAKLEKAARAVADHLGNVSILGSPKGALISINGEKAGVVPLEEPFVVPAGEVVVTVEAPGYASISRKVTVSPRALVRETIDLPAGTPSSEGERSSVSRMNVPPEREPEPPPSLSSLTAPVPEPSANAVAPRAEQHGDSPPAGSQGGASWSWRQSAGTGLAALGLGSLVFGIVKYMGREAAARDFEEAGCGTNNLSIGDCGSRYDQVHSAQTWMIVGFVAAAAFGVGGAYLFWIAPSGPTSVADGRANVSLVPTITFNMTGRF